MRQLIQDEKEASQKNKSSKEPKTIKELLMEELNVVGNLTSRKRYQTFNLGHPWVNFGFS